MSSPKSKISHKFVEGLCPGDWIALRYLDLAATQESQRFRRTHFEVIKITNKDYGSGGWVKVYLKPFRRPGDLSKPSEFYIEQTRNDSYPVGHRSFSNTKLISKVEFKDEDGEYAWEVELIIKSATIRTTRAKLERK